MSGKPQKLELTWFNKDKALIPTENGKYGYTWVDPKDPRYCETRTLVIDDLVTGTQAPKDDDTVYSERADLEPTDDNLLITGESGDVLEALTRVPELADKYVGKVKCIYIDPPFNTAQTFPNYEDNLEHSIWLTMMRDRLVHLRQLLSDDGSIWVHLDDVENHRMRVLLDEVFGAGNFVADISWEKVAGRDNRAIFSKTCDSLMVYTKSRESWRRVRNLLPRVASNTANMYSNPDNDPRGPWTSGDFTAMFNPAENPRESQLYTLVTPSGRSLEPPAGRCWLYTEVEYQKLLKDNRLWFGETGDNAPRIKRFLSEVQDGLVPKTLWPHAEVGTNDSAKKEVQRVVSDSSPFATPKPERLLERIIHIATNPGEIVLDVFAGSGTTAAVAHKMGRRWVTCELVEDTVKRFTLPRLTKVVRGEDPGGITLTKGERVDNTDEGLPEGLSPDEAQQLTSLLNKAIRGEDHLKKDAGIRALKNLVKTKKSKDTVNWRGGGSFAVARLSPSCFDYAPELELVTLTEAATGETLVASVAANLNFRLTPEHRYFHGIRGMMRLVVVEGRLDQDKVDDLVAHLECDEGLTIAATEIDDGVRQYLRTLGRGCRAVHIPTDIFPYRAGKEN